MSKTPGSEWCSELRWADHMQPDAKEVFIQLKANVFVPYGDREQPIHALLALQLRGPDQVRQAKCSNVIGNSPETGRERN